nr:hypothetical protein [Tanacetum cinerariifolium]
MFIEFVIQNQFFSYYLEEFAKILDIPCEGACDFTEKWSLDELAYGVPMDGPYQTNPPSPHDIISSIRIDREGQVCPCLCLMIYYVVNSKKFILAYYMAKRMEWVTRHKRLILPYGMLLTRLFKVIMNENNELSNESYVLYEHVMNPLAAHQERKPRKDHGTRRGRNSTSSSSAFDQPSSSHLNDDDDDDGNGKGTSHNLTDVIPPTSSNISLFHDDPFISIMNSYATFTPSPILVPPPIIKPPPKSPEFFLPKELLSPRKQKQNQYFQDYEMGESLHDSTLEQHGKQIEEILNHLDELPLDR